MKWIFAPLVVALMLCFLVLSKGGGNAWVEVNEKRDEKFLNQKKSVEQLVAEEGEFSWGMPEKKAFRVNRNKSGQLPIEESDIPFEEIMRKSHENGIYAYQAWGLYSRCREYIYLADGNKDFSDDSVLRSCGSFVQKISTHSNNLLYMAAKHGLPDARLDYFIYAFEDFDPLDISDKNSEQMVYAKEAFSMILDEANRGNVDAMLMAAGAYETGVVVEKDLVLSYAFWYSAGRTGLLNSSGEVLETIKGGMTKNQIDEAIAKGDAILFNCCRGRR